MSDRPRIELDFQTAWCPLHLEPFRDDWPAGAAVGMLRLFDAAVRDPRVTQHAGGDADNLNSTLGEFTPLCCFIDAGELSLVYAEAGVDPTAGLERRRHGHGPPV